MFIQVEATPNPSTLKFLPGRQVLEGEGVDFADAKSAEVSPLAQRLFAIKGVARVFLAGDFISVSKTEHYEWPQLKAMVLGGIMEHFFSGQPVMTKLPSANPDDPQQLAPSPQDSQDNQDDDQSDPDLAVVNQVKDLLDSHVRPAVAMDGGDITFHGFERGVVYLTMKGACAGCPSSTATLRLGIENLLRHYLPEVIEVRAVP